MKTITKLVAPLSAALFIGCVGSGGGRLDHTEIALEFNQSIEVFDNDQYESRSDDAIIKLTHHTDSDRRFVTLEQGKGIILRPNE